jgi:acyl carrier protein
MDFVIPLNGSNYVSENTKKAFEEALNDGHQVSTFKSEHNQGNGSAEPPQVQNSASAPQQRPAAPQSTFDPAEAARALESLERGLARSFDHQQMTLRVHEQYLENQSDYAGIFSQLMAQQGEIFANGNTSAEQADAARKVLENLTRSMDRFHELQAQSLEVHQQFLSQQSQYSQAYVQLLQQQQGALGRSVEARVRGSGFDDRRSKERNYTIDSGRDHNNGHDNGNGHHDVAAARVQSASTHEPPPAPPAAVPEPEAVAASSTVDLDIEALAQSLLEIVGEKTGYPAEMLELDMDMEADLGIDSIKRVEILGALQDQYPDLPEVEGGALAELRTLAQIVDYMGMKVAEPPTDSAPAPGPEPETSEPAASVSESDSASESAVGGALDLDELTRSLLEIVGEKTGYPAEMLELDMDMEADLGIDSIKRVEILGALQDHYPDLPEVEGEALAELRTLAQIVDYMDGRAAGPVPAAEGSEAEVSEIEIAAAEASHVEVSKKA